MTKRVVITGMALISPLGSTLDSAYERLQTLENCIEYDENLKQYNGLHTRLCARVKDFVQPEDFTRKVTRTMGEIAIMAVASAKQALKDAGLLDNQIITNGLWMLLWVFTQCVLIMKLKNLTPVLMCK